MGAAYDALVKAYRTYAVDAVTGVPKAVLDGATALSGGPSTRPLTITPDDATDLSESGIGSIYVGGSGNVAVIGLDDTTNGGDGTAVVFMAVPAGTILRVAPRRVLAATTATNLVGLA